MRVQQPSRQQDQSNCGIQTQAGHSQCPRDASNNSDRLIGIIRINALAKPNRTYLGNNPINSISRGIEGLEEGTLTALSIEEHEGLVEGKRVIIRRRIGASVARHRLDDQDDQSDQNGGGEDAADSPLEHLPADNYAAQINIPLLLLLRGAQQPALLRLVQRPRQRRPVQVLQVPAPVVVGGGIVGVDLQRAAPRVPTVHTHFGLLSSGIGNE
nr:hypothetical protein Iba_chr01cCG6620 [Ipomoea batatas]